MLAQVLLERAWNTSLQDGVVVKPWPWADSWPVGRLRQDRLGVDLIVLESVSGEALAFGPGRLEAGDILGGELHTILAGHRDTSFSFLQHLRVGDTLEVESYDGEKSYRVSSTRTIPASSLYLDSEMRQTLSLVTCYPFGAIVPHTKMRFLVTASVET
ncbi:class GN sortase [Desulforhopalus sp. 52FAK]